MRRTALKPRKYTKRDVDRAIKALTDFGLNGDMWHITTNLDPNSPEYVLAWDAYIGVNYCRIRANENAYQLEALEAAARLREGRMPRTPSWGKRNLL